MRVKKREGDLKDDDQMYTVVPCDHYLIVLSHISFYYTCFFINLQFSLLSPLFELISHLSSHLFSTFLLFFLLFSDFFFFLPLDPNTQEGDLWGFSPEIKKKGASDIPLSNGQPVVGMKGVRVTVEEQKRRALAMFGTEGVKAVEGADANNGEILESGSKSNIMGSNTDKLHRIEQKMEADMKRVGREVEGELWWIFQVS